jgi:hypothetical protein
MIYNISFVFFTLIFGASLQYLALRYIWDVKKKSIKVIVILTQILVILFILIKYLGGST